MEASAGGSMDRAGWVPPGPGLGCTSLLAGCPVRSGAEETLVPGWSQERAVPCGTSTPL